MAGSSSITISWDIVPPIDQNGIILGYSGSLRLVRNNRGISFASVAHTRSFSVGALEAFEEYRILLLAYNSYNGLGFGPFSQITVRTLEDGKREKPNGYG